MGSVACITDGCLSDRMIFNTYAMMQSLRHLQDRPLSVDRILEMHRLLMREALDDPSQAGRLRTAEDNVIVRIAATDRLRSSDERRVGKGCCSNGRYRWAPVHYKKKR